MSTENEPGRGPAGDRNDHFTRAVVLAEAGRFHEAIDLCLEGLHEAPDSIRGHQVLRQISLKRKVAGGRDLGILERIKAAAPVDGVQAVLSAAKLLAYEPIDLDRVVCLWRAAPDAGLANAAEWASGIVAKANG